MLLIFNLYRLPHCPERLNLMHEISFGSTDKMQASATTLGLSSLMRDTHLMQQFIYYY